VGCFKLDMESVDLFRENAQNRDQLRQGTKTSLPHFTWNSVPQH